MVREMMLPPHIIMRPSWTIPVSLDHIAHLRATGNGSLRTLTDHDVGDGVLVGPFNRLWLKDYFRALEASWEALTE